MSDELPGPVVVSEEELAAGSFALRTVLEQGAKVNGETVHVTGWIRDALASLDAKLGAELYRRLGVL